MRHGLIWCALGSATLLMVTGTAALAQGKLVGSWERCEGIVESFSYDSSNATYVGKIENLGNRLGRVGFQVGEITFKDIVREAGKETYKGQVKSRSSASNFWWGPVTITVSDNLVRADTLDYGWGDCAAATRK